MTAILLSFGQGPCSSVLDFFFFIFVFVVEREFFIFAFPLNSYFYESGNFAIDLWLRGN